MPARPVVVRPARPARSFRDLKPVPRLRPVPPGARDKDTCPKCQGKMVPCPDGEACSWDGRLHAGGGHACGNGTNVTTNAELFTPHRGGDTGNVPAARG